LLAVSTLTLAQAVQLSLSGLQFGHKLPLPSLSCFSRIGGGDLRVHPRRHRLFDLLLLLQRQRTKPCNLVESLPVSRIHILQLSLVRSDFDLELLHVLLNAVLDTLAMRL
jgi:hypothetical protein